MGGFLAMIVLGLIIGAVAKLVMPGDDPGGIIGAIVLLFGYRMLTRSRA